MVENKCSQKWAWLEMGMVGNGHGWKWAWLEMGMVGNGHGWKWAWLEMGMVGNDHGWKWACISNPSVRVTIHCNLQDMYMRTRPPFVLQGMVALPSFIILDFCVCNFNLVWSDSSSAELWLLVDTHHDTRIRAEVSAILTFTHAKLAH